MRQYRFHQRDGAAARRSASADRKPAGTSPATLLDGGTYSLADSAGKVVVLNFWGIVVRAVPDRDAQLRRAVPAGEAATASTFVGIDVKDTSGQRATSFVKDNDITLPDRLRRDGQDRAASWATSRASACRSPSSSTSSSGSPRCTAVPCCPADLQPVADVAGSRSPDRDRVARQRLHRHRHRRVAARRGGRRRAGRAGRVPVAVRAAARARLPVLRRRAVRCRTSAPQPRRMVAGALLFVLGFTAIFVAAGRRCSAASARRSASTGRRSSGSSGVVTIVLGFVFLGRISVPAARVPHPPAARRGPGRRAAARRRRSGSAGRRASPRRSAPCTPGARRQRGRPGAARS